MFIPQMNPRTNDETGERTAWFNIVWEDESTAQIQGPMTGVGAPTREAAQGFADELNAVVNNHAEAPAEPAAKGK